MPSGKLWSTCWVRIVSLTPAQIAFVIPLGTKPEQCHDGITPNDMRTSLSCAFTGALLLFGGMAVVTWSLLRTVALHLQVCWEMVIGPTFMWLSFVTGLGIPVLVTTLMMIFTGVSYRFGDVCHINSPNSLGDYWIPLMVIASISLVLQVFTMAYCIHVYVRSLFDPDPTSTTNSELPSYQGSVRTVTARQAYKRVRRVIQLQWRSMALVLTILINVIFFAIVFIKLNNSLKLTPANIQASDGWIVCLAINKDPSKCVDAASGVALNEATLITVLVLLSIANFWNFIFTVRWTMVLGWVDLVKGRFVQRVEFVSVDARSHFPDTRTYEMLNSRQQNLKTPEPVVRLQSPAPVYGSGFDDDHDDDHESYYGREAKYQSPAMSFSGPRPPSAAQNQSSRQWDPSTSFARSNSQQNHRQS